MHHRDGSPHSLVDVLQFTFSFDIQQSACDDGQEKQQCVDHDGGNLIHTERCGLVSPVDSCYQEDAGCQPNQFMNIEDDPVIRFPGSAQPKPGKKDEQEKYPCVYHM